MADKNTACTSERSCGCYGYAPDCKRPLTEKDPFGIDQHTSGAKLDDGKVDASLLVLFANALTEVARVGTYGAVKYTRGGFLSVPMGFIRYTAAMIRHLFAETTEGTYDQDKFFDTEKGKPFKNSIRHDAQVAWNALARLEVRLREERNAQTNNSNEG